MRGRPDHRPLVSRVLWRVCPFAGTARPRHFSIFAFFVFCVSFAQSAFQKGTRMRRVDLVRRRWLAGRGSTRRSATGFLRRS